MNAFVRWYIAVEILGALSLPLAWRLFARLPDRGHSVSKVLGILLVGFILWTGTAYGLLRNELGGVVIACFIVALLSGIVGWPILRRSTYGGPRQSRLRLPRPLPAIVASEVLFLLGFAGWALVRAHDPAANHTEQPMDLLFLSAVWNSPTVPPLDPWLAGYSISYYYFGYWLVATIARLAGSPPEIAYNLGQASWFGLLLAACWGVGFNLAALGRRRGEAAARGPMPMVGGLLAVMSVALIGNLQGLLDALRVGSDLIASWVGGRPLRELLGPIGTDWWWWRSSRVVSDRDHLGQPIEIIDEYPFFSYLLGDNHPHLLAMPFVLLVVALALSLSLGGSDGHGPRVAAVGRFPGGRVGLMITIVAAGGLIFLNPWDLPPTWALLIAASGLAAPGRSVALALMLGVGTAIAYFPYMLSVQTQVLGLRPNLFHPTLFDQFFRVFGLFAPGLAALVGVAWASRRPGTRLLTVSLATVGTGSVLWLAGSALWAFGTRRGHSWVEQIPAPPGAENHLGFALERWATGWVTLAMLVTVLALVIAMLWSCRGPASVPRDWALRFVLLLTAIGLGLAIVPELVYLLDAFGTRMNTVFKLYYQAWLLLGLAASHGTYIALRSRGSLRAVGIVSLAVLGAGLTFPAVTLSSRLLAAGGHPLTLDALAYLHVSDADEVEAIRWVRAHTRPDALVLQAVGASYQPSDGRVSIATGRATLLGWEGHEAQWRGGAFAGQAAGRAQAVRDVYGEGPAEALTQLLEKWRIDYVYLGPREQAKYGVTPAGRERLNRVMELAFRHGNVLIYRRRG